MTYLRDELSIAAVVEYSSMSLFNVASPTDKWIERLTPRVD
jgi:hypothetical protein